MTLANDIRKFRAKTSKMKIKVEYSKKALDKVRTLCYTPDSSMRTATGKEEDMKTGQAELVKVRVPFRKSRFAWSFEGKRIMLDSIGCFPNGAILLDVENNEPARYLDLKNGEVYSK